MRPFLRRWATACAVAVAAGAAAAAAEAQEVVSGALMDAKLRSRANGVLQVLSFTAIPDSTASALSISSDDTGDPHFRQTQLGGAFTVSERTPIYLEGFIGATRYDPEFVFSGGESTRSVPTRWSGVTATGGVGYDFDIGANWVFRPIVNTMLGYMASDLKLLTFVIDRQADPDLDFIDGGDLLAVGGGGSVMLDYEHRSAAYDADIELRFTSLFVRSFGGDAVEGQAHGQTAALWTRLRYPTGLRAFDAPVRLVVEGAHSSFFGANRGALGFTDLSQVGLGIEFDTESKGVILTRTRLVGRYVFGRNVSGFGVGLGVSF
ncbi:autotransporter domain-containing protein [Rubrimonas cliftonensis]|uniref:Uncharacterized protein n=1 Tax=Rubrimonas cliftonensis TaxID=89524 RepID=A0A1H3YUE0_9RHOB|nr:autotransporter domain-containing protein [Rubrimonas cliftonensis]SEA14688.1 hypothetical protein SAMN05444370_103238 [Rubrimonas cliftonensis]